MNLSQTRWYLRLSLFLLLIGLSFPAQAPAQQAPKIPIGRKAELTWIAPQDTDVVKYKAYFTSSRVDSVVFNEWWKGNISDSSMYQIEMKLPIGTGYCELIAIDRSNNFSGRSNKAYYEITDPPPGNPSGLIIRVLHE